MSISPRTGTAQTRRRRARAIPTDEHIERLKRRVPQLFDPYDAEGIAQELINNGATKHENVQLETMTFYVHAHQRIFDDQYVKTVRRPGPSAPLPDAGSLATAAAENILRGDTVVDGKPLRRWTWGRFRKVYAWWGEMITKFADRPDNALIGDALDK